MQLATFFLVLEDFMLPCFTKKVFGIDCPGCGLQRAVSSLFQGDFSAAWEMYPAIFTIFPLFGILIANQFIETKYFNKIISILLVASVVLIITNYISKFI